MADARYDAMRVQLKIDLISTGSYINCLKKEQEGERQRSTTTETKSLKTATAAAADLQMGDSKLDQNL